jgi:hypothetical protein
MADKQEQTLSLRISDALRKRLEQVRKLASVRKGEDVSTSEIAKQLLESAREDRLEVVELLRAPTEALLGIWKKGEAQRLLSKAEWTVLAYFAQQGAEAVSKNLISRESVIAILGAFLAVYKLRIGPGRGDEGFYLGNLPVECRPATSKPTDPGTPDTLRQTVAETLRLLRDPAVKWRPLEAARNLYVLLDHEKFSGVDTLNQALRPYWTALWRVAARGHYFLMHRPVRDTSRPLEHAYQPAIPSVREGQFILTFLRKEGNDFEMLLTFPGPRGPMYPLGGYPIISEFRAMLWAPEDAGGSIWRWDGEHFFGYVVEREKEKEFWFRAHKNGITLGFSKDELGAVRELFRRAWELPELRAAWDSLSLEYGEL